MVCLHWDILKQISVISYFLFPIPCYLLKSGRQYQDIRTIRVIRVQKKRLLCGLERPTQSDIREESGLVESVLVTEVE